MKFFFTANYKSLSGDDPEEAAMVDPGQKSVDKFSEKTEQPTGEEREKDYEQGGDYSFHNFQMFFSRNDQAWISGCWPKRSTKDFFFN